MNEGFAAWPEKNQKKKLMIFQKNAVESLRNIPN